MNRILTAFIAATVFILPAAAAEDEVKDSLAFDKAHATAPADLLRGRVSGVRVQRMEGGANGAFKTTIRGVNSLRYGSSPLWIVDGVMINPSLDGGGQAFFQYGENAFSSSQNAFSFLNAADIERIEIIKDLSATALYGIRGADGVIIINTIKPAQEGLNLSWSSDLDYEEGSRGVGHRHTLCLSSSLRQNKYQVSAWFRSREGLIRGDNSNYGGVRAIFESRTNNIFWFGMNFAASIGKAGSASGPAWFGHSSHTLALRQSGYFLQDIPSAWESDYDDNARERRLTNAVWLTVNFTKTLSLKTTVGVDFQNYKRYFWYGDALRFGQRYNGAAALASSMLFRYNANSELSWKTYLAQHHRIEAAAAGEVAGEITSFNNMNGTNFFSKDLRAKGISLAGSKAELHAYDHKHLNYGFLGRISYAFKDLAGLDGVLRLDRTPRYDDGINLYGGATAWVDLKYVRIRGGFGEAGREQYIPGLVGGEAGMFYEGLNRVRSMEYNIGADVKVLKDRLKFSAVWFDKRTSDILSIWCFGELSGNYWREAPRSLYDRRASLLANRGFEFDLAASLYKSKNWDISLRANFTLTANQILRIDDADIYGNNLGSGISPNMNVVGFPVGAFAGYLEKDGNYVDMTGDGVINAYDKVIIGNPIPKYHGGAELSVRWRDLTFDTQIYGAAGFDLLNLNRLFFQGSKPYTISESLVEKGNYLKLGRISLGYDIPLRSRRVVKGVQLRLSALNLATLTRYSGYDPETDCLGVSPMSSGIDYGSFPFRRRYILGVSVKF